MVSNSAGNHEKYAAESDPTKELSPAYQYNIEINLATTPAKLVRLLMTSYMITGSTPNRSGLLNLIEPINYD